MTRIFICNAPSDRNICAPYVAAIVDRGVEVWFENETVADDNDLSEETKHQLEQASTMLIFLTPNADNSIRASNQTMVYLNLLFEGKSGRILPVRIIPSRVPKMLKAWPLVDAIGISVNDAAETTMAALKIPTDVSGEDIFANIFEPPSNIDTKH